MFGKVRTTLLRLALQLSGKNIYAEYEWLKNQCVHSLESNLVIQQQRLKQLLLHAWKHVPYYRSQLEEVGVVVGGNVRMSKFHEAPPLTRDLLRNHFDDLKSKDREFKRRCPFINRSGGSTGQPVRFIQDNVYWTRANAVKWLFYSFAANYPCRNLSLWGSERDILQQSRGLRARIGDLLLDRKLLNSFRMTPTNMHDYVGAINAFRPDIIEAYAQSIYELAQFVRASNYSKLHKPKGIIAAAGTLYPPMRDLIETTFGSRVFNRYGTREVGDIACSCEFSNKLHVDVFNNVVEVLDKNLEPCAPGEMGKVYVTTLNNFSMPLIRYDLGDLAIPSEPDCTCGRGLPSLASVEGREMSVIRTRQGGVVPAEFFIHFVGVVFNKGFIKQFQIIQEDYDTIRIKAAIGNQVRFSAEKPGIESAIREVMGGECDISWEYVDEIPPLPSGKFLYVVSRIESKGT